MKVVFTTGEAAKVTGLSIRTICRCCDDGSLRHYKVPGSKFRRIQRSALIEFCRTHNLPALAGLEQSSSRSA